MQNGGPSARSGLTGALVVLATLGGLLLWAHMLVSPWRLVSGLVDAGRHLDRGEKALTNTALRVAQYEIFAGTAAARRARAGLEAESPLFDVARLSSTADSALGEVDHLVAASKYSADAAIGTFRIAKNALRGPTRIIATDEENPEDSQIRLDRVEEIALSVDKIRTNLDGIQKELSAVELTDLPRRVRPDVVDGLEKAAEAEAVISDAQAGFAILPDVLGGNGPRTYLIGMQNSAEQRGTGGAILRFSLFTFDEGKSDIAEECKPQDTACSASESVYDIDKNRQLLDIPLPKDAWYVRGIEDTQRFGNANWSPDWPLSARLMLDYAEEADKRLPGEQLPEVDGFFVLDPTVMEHLIPGTGPFSLKDFGNHITGNKAVHFLLYKAYASYPEHGKRRAALRAVVDQFIDKLLSPAHPTDLVEGMSKSLATKHMMIWMKDPQEQAFIERMNWDGAIEEAENADYMMAVEQNVGGNKFDYYSENETTMDIAIEGSNSVTSIEMNVTNGTFFPQPSWAMGDSGRPDAEGNPQVPTHEPMMNLYVPDTARLTGSAVKGTRIDTPDPAVWTNAEPPVHEESRKKVWSATLQIPPNKEGSVRFDYTVPDVVQEKDGRLSYRLFVQHQPRVRPELLNVRLALPDDAAAVVAPGWARDGDTLVWEKPLTKDVILKVTWE